MKLPPKPVHSEGEGDLCLKSDVFARAPGMARSALALFNSLWW